MQGVPIMNQIMGQNPGMNGNQTQPQQQQQQPQQMTMTQQHGIPLTQPLVINTSFAGTLNNAQTVTMTAPVQVKHLDQICLAYTLAGNTTSETSNSLL